MSDMERKTKAASNPSRRMPRMRNSLGFAIMGVFALVVFGYARWSEKTTIRLRLVNDSKIVLSEIRVVHEPLDVEAARLTGEKPLDIELAPKTDEPIVIQFNDPQGNPYTIRYVMSELADIPRPGDTFQLSIAKVGDHTVEAAPEVKPATNILRTIGKFFGG
ncbi:MAG: hypothetical protein NVSMB14_04130 [Isosphaeraceae bacterium]